MGDKKKISDIVDSVNKQFDEIERKKAHLEKVAQKHKTVTKAPPKVEENRHQVKMKEMKQQQNFRMKEKLIHAVVVFIIGHLLLLPLYLKFPHLIVGMFVCASISLGVICMAVIDFT